MKEPTAEVTRVRTTMARRIATTVLCLIGLGLTTTPISRATIIVADDFAYADGIVGGGEQNGGMGWADAWGASSSVNSPSNEFTIAGGQAIFTGNTANQEIITHERTLSSAVTVGALDTVTIDFDLIIGPADGQAGRGIGVNFLSGGGIVYTLGKRINAGIGVWADGLGTGSAQLSDGVIGQTAGTTYTLSATLTYDGADTAMSLTDGSSTLSATFADTQLSVDAIQLTGYHRLTVGNGVDNFSIDVTTIPEPATALLFGIAAGGLLLRRRHLA